MDRRCDKFVTEGERAGRQELRKGVLSAKSGRALWSCSRPHKWDWTIPISKRDIWSGSWLLPSRQGREERPYVLCTVFTLMGFSWQWKMGNMIWIHRKGLV